MILLCSIPDGKYRKIGYYDFANDNLTLDTDKIVWSGKM